MTRMMVRRAMILGLAAWACGAAGAETYLARLQETVGHTRSNLTALTATADRAAAEFVSGGNLWAADRQADFVAEACGRAGGLMAIAPLDRQVPGRHDVILYAVPGRLEQEDLRTINDWQHSGATVVTFRSPAGLFDSQFPIDTVANVVELWTWTGEFVAACTRLNKMPVLYLSYGLPAGAERARKYQGRRFHDDLAIPPIKSRVLGGRYLDEIEGILTKLNQAQLPQICQAAQWWGRATSATTLVTGHMFPRHAQDPRAPRVSDVVAAPAWEDRGLVDPGHPPSFILYLGYQFAPQKLVEQAKATGMKLVYTDVQPARPPEPAGHILYIDPGWPLTDGCVAVPGYDIPILPASGVAQAAIYWSIASERARLNR
jgi:hypothetical protein